MLSNSLSSANLKKHIFFKHLVCVEKSVNMTTEVEERVMALYSFFVASLHRIYYLYRSLNILNIYSDNMPYFKTCNFHLWIYAENRVLLQGKKLDIWDKTCNSPSPPQLKYLPLPLSPPRHFKNRKLISDCEFFNWFG